MNKILLFVIFAFSILGMKAQVSQGGEPIRWLDKTLSEQIPFVETPPIDLEYLAMEDAITDLDKRLPYRFGVEFEVQYGL